MKLELTLKNKEHIRHLFQIVADQAVLEGHQFQFHWPQSLIQQAIDKYVFFVDQADSDMSVFICYQLLGQDFEILALGCNPVFREQGRMRKLLMSFLAAASAAGGAVFLEVHEKNTNAIKLYKSIGFKEIHIRRAYYKDGAAALMLKYSADEPL